MKMRLSLIALSCLAFVLTLTAVDSRPALAAGPTGVYDILVISGDCTYWELYSTAGVDQPGPSNYTETVTDGLGNVISTRTQAGGIGTYTYWGGGTLTAAAKANPITVHVVMDGVVIANASADSPCLPGALYQGVPIPSGFVLRTITCDTPVYDTAGGSPLSTGEKVTAGQTWFIDPTPKAVNGKNWTAIFNNGALNGYIPTSCVGGKPAGYTGN